MRISARKICRTITVIAIVSFTVSLISVVDFDGEFTKQHTKSDVLELFKRNHGRQLSDQNDKQVVAEVVQFNRKTNGFVDDGKDLKTIKHLQNENLYNADKTRKTLQSDLYISVKTTKSNREKRLQLLMDTWISMAREETFLFSDNNTKVPENFPADHFINTKCDGTHYRRALCCKMGKEFDVFIEMKKRWFCHVDDDNYVNVAALTEFLQRYNHSKDWYLGRPSISHPIEVLDRANPGQRIAFWFATGGAGFCISKGLAKKMVPYAGGGRIATTGDLIRLPDDCTVGYIINHILKVPLTTVTLFHSHLEGLHRIPILQLNQQLTFSYSKSNVINIKGYSMEEDPTRFRTIHCYLYPASQQCDDFPR